MTLENIIWHHIVPLQITCTNERTCFILQLYSPQNEEAPHVTNGAGLIRDGHRLSKDYSCSISRLIKIQRNMW